MAFMVLALGQIAHVIAIHAGDESIFRVGFSKNRFMLYAVIATLVLQFAVIFVPFLANVFDTALLSAVDFVVAFALASGMLIWVEGGKAIRNSRRKSTPALATA
jgi:P-type Ca2+ transporter type 2C